MTDRLQDVFNAIASDVEAIIHVLMDKEGVGEQRSSVKQLRDRYRKEDVVVNVSSGGGGAVVEVIYDSLLEWDRKPRTGKQPSVADVREWALSKNLPADNRTLNLIRRSIWWNGHAGRSIEEALEHEIEACIDRRWGDMILEAVSKELEKYFR